MQQPRGSGRLLIHGTTSTDHLLPYTFMNDGGWMQDVPASYGARSIATIRAVSRKYDTKQVFQKLRSAAGRSARRTSRMRIWLTKGCNFWEARGAWMMMMMMHQLVLLV